MSDKMRAKKLAAAKKKLKEYQTKEKHLIDVDSSDTSEYGGSMSNTKKHNQDQQQQQQQQNTANHDTQQYYQQQIQHQYQRKQQEIVNKNNENSPTNDFTINNDNRNDDKFVEQQQQIDLNPISEYFKNSSENFMKTVNNEDIIDVKMDQINVMDKITTTTATNQKNSNFQIQSSSEKPQLNAMEILIAEKSTLTSELIKQQTLYKEKLLENEELIMQLQMITKRNKLLENEINELHIQNKNFKLNLDDLNKRYDEQKYEYEHEKLKYNEIKEHLDEIKNELNEENKRNNELEKRLKDKSCELELCQIRINQISDEANLATDNRVEVLTQTKFLYEQQIRDLQAMVQQLTTEKDQSNQQYQNYVQHLNKEITNLSEKNSELITDNEKLTNRERTLIEHIGNLEKQIQENIIKQENLKKEINQANVENSTSNDNEKLEFENEMKILLEDKLKIENEIQLKDHKIDEIMKNLIDKDNYIKELEDKIENILLEKPDNNKLLATMESDKIAASRAISQNENLKIQLNEIEQKLIQITDDKVELVNLLDSEQYKNRKIRENYDEMEKQLKEIKDKLHFKDEEMIRLTHEHNELNKTILKLNQQIDHLMHHEAKEYLKRKKQLVNENENVEKRNDDNNSNENDENNSSNHDHSHENHHHDHDHDHKHHHENEENCENSDDAQECIEEGSDSKHSETNKSKILDEDKNDLISSDDDYTVMNGIPTHEAMEKLQERFRKLMLEVADLTDEKQRLEHLVGQLQGETETIGEYITLYQTQRRLLKQKEIEKTTQLHMLLAEREEMKDKISNLTQLVENLIHGYGKNQKIETNFTSEIKNTVNNTENNENSDIKNNSIDFNIPIDNDNNKNTNTSKNLSNMIECNENTILTKIHSIIAEIKQKEDNLEANLKFVPSVDHCACCSGKFETI